MAEFTIINNNILAYIKLLPFFAIKDLFLQISVDILEPFNTNTYGQIYK